MRMKKGRKSDWHHALCPYGSLLFAAFKKKKCFETDKKRADAAAIAVQLVFLRFSMKTRRRTYTADERRSVGI